MSWRAVSAVVVALFLGPLIVPLIVTKGYAYCQGVCKYDSKERVAAVAYDAGFRGFALVYAIAVSYAESIGFALNAINQNPHSTDYGLWQINSSHLDLGYSANDLLTDDADNAAAAYSVYSAAAGGPSFCPWTEFRNGDFAHSVDNIARPAAQAIDSTVIRRTAQESSRIRATANVYVRTAPAPPDAGLTLIREVPVPTGTTGTVVDGPRFEALSSTPCVGYAEPQYYVWWKIHWDDGGADGWSVEDALARIGASLAVQLATDSATATTRLYAYLTAIPSGTATGTFNYTFWWDCNDRRTAVDQVTAACGDPRDPSIGAIGLSPSLK